MCNSPSAASSESPRSPDFHKRLKRLRLFDKPSVWILGLTACVIFSFFFLDYRGLAKGLISSAQRYERFFGVVRIDDDEEYVGGHDGSSRKKMDFLDGGCDLFDGDWVWDESYPLYHSRACTFLDVGFRCSENGRPDVLYTKWRWQPKGCNLPRFDAKIMLNKLRGKRVVFVGDSIGRNQWESLLCMLSIAVLNKDSVYEVNGNAITKHKGTLIFRFKDYNCTVEYYRAPFLVLQSRPPANVPPKIQATLNLDQMVWSWPQWRDADVIVFNTGHWWNYKKTIRGGCYFQEGLAVKMDMKIETAYKKSLETVMRWIRREVNSNKTQVFFRTYAPVHFRGGGWRSGGACHLDTLPELDSSKVPSHISPEYDMFAQVISRNSNITNLIVLNTTHLSYKRKDGHSSLYYLEPGRGPAPLHRQDCSHWCLPGVPDAWNELLFALILKREAIRT